MTDCLIDSGNTRIKFASRDHDQWHFLTAIDFEHPQWMEHCLDVLESEPFEKIYVAAVSKGARAQRLEQFLQRCNLPIVRVETLPNLGRLHIAYPEAKQLGVDRFLALLAISNQEIHSIIISFGSAITIDVLAADGIHQGGLIAPSPEFQWRTMRDHFTGLFEDWKGYPQTLATNTSDALAAGIEYQCLGMIERVIALHAIKHQTQVLVTGGAAQQWLEKLPKGSIYAPQLLFDGLHRYISLSRI
jgi:type III pantothenate kinase